MEEKSSNTVIDDSSYLKDSESEQVCIMRSIRNSRVLISKNRGTTTEMPLV